MADLLVGVPVRADPGIAISLFEKRFRFFGHLDSVSRDELDITGSAKIYLPPSCAGKAITADLFWL